MPATEDTRDPAGSNVSWVGIVDDNPSVRSALARVLRGNGISVETFESAEEFLSRSIGAKPDCMVVDIHLGGMNGIELWKLLNSRGAAPPTVFITGHDDELYRRAALHRGCGLLRKPFDTKALVALLRPHLRATFLD